MRYTLITFTLFALTHFSNAITLDSVITRSDSCVAIQWTPDSANTNPSWYIQYGSRCTGSDSVYKQCDFIPGRNYSGIAYSYGGEDPWFLFRDRLQAGFLVGSHLCHYETYNDPSDRVTGTDCSGFLSFVWDIPRTTTSILNTSAAYRTIPISEVKAGDALVTASSGCGNHVVLIVEAQDLKEVVISEASSSVRGCRERLVDLTHPVWSCYKAIRHPGLINSQLKPSELTLGLLLLKYTINIKSETIQLNMEQSFSGTIIGYLPNGSYLFKKNILTPESMISIKRSGIQSNIIIISMLPSTHQKASTFTIALQ